MSILSNTVFQTVISGVLVFLIGETIQDFVLAPLKEFKRNIGIIDNKLKYHAGLIVSPKLATNLAPDLSKILRELSCDLESSYKQVPGKWVLAKINVLPRYQDVLEAAKTLIFLSNSVDKNGIPLENNTALETIREILKIKAMNR